MKRRILYFLFIFVILLPGVFYAGYMAHKNRVFPIRPFVKRTLIELGVSETTLNKLRNNELPEITQELSSIDIDSAYYSFEGKIFDLPTTANYGGIEAYGDGIIFVDGEGLIWYFSDGDFKLIRSNKIPNIIGLEKSEASDIDHDFAVVKDISIIDNYIYASATEYVVPKDCVNVSIYRINFSDGLNSEMKFGDWEKLFNTEPCIKITREDEDIDMIEAGGRIIGLSKKEILFSVGAFGKDGINGKNHSQDRASHYGKMIRLDLSTFASEIFTIGHRNPQGLLLTQDGRVFSTEHGPQGGDELNLIIEGKNYGWPLVTFGTQYNEYTWPMDEGLIDHSGFEKPVYSWVPSIGISHLIEINNKTLPNWDGDLLVSSLYAVSLYRVRFNNQSPIVVEPIYVGSRVRDIVNFGDGFALQIDQENKLIIMERDL